MRKIRADRTTWASSQGLSRGTGPGCRYLGALQTGRTALLGAGGTHNWPFLVKILHSTEDHPRAKYPTKAFYGPWMTKGQDLTGRELSGGSNPLGRGISLQAF